MKGIPADWMDDEIALDIIHQHAKAYADYKKRS
jgi:hypothetical protein